VVAALLPCLPWTGLGQSVSDYPSFKTAIETSTVITNFVSNSVISLTTLGQTFVITNSILIDGTSNNIVIDGENFTRLFQVNSNAQLVLNNVQLLRGLSTNGGAIFNEGTLILSNDILAGNIASNVNGLDGASAPTNNPGANGTNATAGGGALGGAIYSTGPVMVYNSVFLTNQALAGSGGNGGNGANNPAGDANPVTGVISGGNGGNGGPGAGAFGGAVMSIGSSNVFFATEFISNNCVAGDGGQPGLAGTGGLNIPVGSTGEGEGGGAAAGGGLYVTGSVLVSNCLFYTNTATGGSTGAAQLNADGSGYSGNAGAPAGGGGLYISNSAPTADIENTIFFYNVCNGGDGGDASGNATAGGNGGAVYGGGLFTAAKEATVRNCTLATNLLNPGMFGVDSSTNGINGQWGDPVGPQVYRSAGVARLANSILSGEFAPNAVGVLDGGYNISSDNSPAKVFPSTLHLYDPGLDSGLSMQGGPYLGPVNNPNFGTLTLALIAGSPATNYIPGVPGLSFTVTDERGWARGTPGSVGAFEANTITPTNTAPASITAEPTSPAAKLGASAQLTVTAVANSNDTNTLGYQWQLNGTNINNNGTFSGANTASLTIKNIAYADLGAYQVIISPSLLDSVTNSTYAYLLVDIPPSFKSQPASRLNEPNGAIVSFKAKIAGAPPFFLQWQTNGVPLTDGNEFSGSGTTNLTINPATFQDAASYTLVVTNFFRSVTSAVARLTIVPDTTRPTVTIASPHAGQRTTNTIVSGTATDNAQVTNVYVWITNIFAGVTNVSTNSAILSTNGTTTKTWTNVSGVLLPGTNIVAVRSVDYSSNVSTVVVRRFFYVKPSLFTLVAPHNGTLTGSASIAGNTRPTNGAQLNLGESYTLVARPDSGYLLSNWVGTTFTGYSNPLHFTMTTNLSIQANFVPSPFGPVAGVYNGLFYPTNSADVSEQTAGMISHLTVSSLGVYSGKLLLDGAGYALSGVFDIFGRVTNRIVRPTARGGPVEVALAVGWTNSHITGTVFSTNEGGWTSTNYMEEAETLPTGGDQQLTVLLPPSTNATGTVPPGYGFIFVTNHLGDLILAGALPDASTFTQSVPVGKLSDVPVFANLYGNTGFVLGWINLTNGMVPGATNLTWIEPARPGLYPDGFTNSMESQLSEWVAGAALSVSSGTLTISNAGLYLTNQISLTGKTVAMTSGSPDSLHGTFNPNTGALKLIFDNGTSKATMTGYAAFLQSSNTSGGYFTTKTADGLILWQP
jgi:hypothetical protein